MSNIWFPLPVALFLRRVVNIISTLSITHHYLFPFPPRSTIADSNVEYLPSSFPCAGRDLLYPNACPRQVAERNVWVAAVEIGLLDHILQGVDFFAQIASRLTFSVHSIEEAVHTLVSLARATRALPRVYS
jgi:hypothetical protein